VYSGSVLQNGYVEVEVTEKAENSTIRKLNQAVSDVQVIFLGGFSALIIM
jgi:cation transport ATPase